MCKHPYHMRDYDSFVLCDTKNCVCKGLWHKANQQENTQKKCAWRFCGQILFARAARFIRAKRCSAYRDALLCVFCLQFCCICFNHAAPRVLQVFVFDAGTCQSDGRHGLLKAVSRVIPALIWIALHMQKSRAFSAALLFCGLRGYPMQHFFCCLFSPLLCF